MYIFAIRGVVLIGRQCNYCMIVWSSVYIFVIRGVVLFIYCIITRQCTYLLSVVLSCLSTVCLSIV